MLDKYKKVCTCKQITQSSIKKLIANGYDNLTDIQEKTGAGTGACKGKFCTERILELIDEYWENK